MSKARRINYFNKYRNILGNTRQTIEAIQKFIESNPSSEINENDITETNPAESINRILDSMSTDETNMIIRKLINSL